MVNMHLCCVKNNHTPSAWILQQAGRQSEVDLKKFKLCTDFFKTEFKDA